MQPVGVLVAPAKEVGVVGEHVVARADALHPLVVAHVVGAEAEAALALGKVLRKQRGDPVRVRAFVGVVRVLHTKRVNRPPDAFKRPGQVVEEVVGAVDEPVDAALDPVDDGRVELLEQQLPGIAVFAAHARVGRDAPPRRLQRECKLADAAREALSAEARGDEAAHGEHVLKERVLERDHRRHEVGRAVLVACPRARARERRAHGPRV